jgi:hypothetical protein
VLGVNGGAIAEAATTTPVSCLVLATIVTKEEEVRMIVAAAVALMFSSQAIPLIEMQVSKAFKRLCANKPSSATLETTSFPDLFLKPIPTREFELCFITMDETLSARPFGARTTTVTMPSAFRINSATPLESSPSQLSLLTLMS